MNSRERVWAVLEGRKPDRIPFNFWMDRNLMAELDKKWGPEFRISHYGADVLESFILYDWNCGLPAHTVSDHKTSWQVAPTLGDMKDVYKLQFPEIKGNEQAIYSKIESDRKQFPDIAIFAMTLTPLDCFFNLRLMENALMDFYDYPKECDYFFENYSRVLTDLVKGLKGKDADVLYLAGDICATTGPMMSLEMIRKYCFEPIKGAIDEAHKLGLKVFYHTDGAVEKVLPLFIEYGFDGINPLQPHLNDSEAFKRNYGKKLMLYGGIDNCFAVPNNTPEGVRQHIRDQYAVLGKEGGLIFSSHDIPDFVDIENVDAMVDEIKRCIP